MLKKNPPPQPLILMCSPKHTTTTASEAVKDKKCSGKCRECREKKKETSALIKTIGVMVFLLCGTTVFAQETGATAPSFWSDPVHHPMMPLYLISAFVFITIVLVLIVALYMVRIINMLTTQAEKERATKLGIAYVPRPSWWKRFNKTMNAAVPVEQEQSIELDHNYDGIKELDNHLPPWWKWLFIGTIVWSGIYIFVYHFSDSLPLQTEEYQTEVTRAEEQAILNAAGKPESVIDENTLVYSADAEILANGSKVFTINCVACHKADGGGNAIGPNLTDAYWLHGGELKNIFKTIKDGVVEKGMPAWGKAMSPKDVRDATFYVISLQGTNPPGAKAPQGNLHTPAPVKADTVSLPQAQTSL